MSTSQLGPLIRLWGIGADQLPSTTESPAELAPFLISLLQEAVPLIDSAAPRSADSSDPATAKLWKAKGSKSAPETAAKVEVTERVISTADLQTLASRHSLPHKAAAETWCCRRSVHEDRAATGTASWAEFEHCFRDAHAAAECAFTPNVQATHEALVWDCGDVQAAEGGATWGRFSLKVEEMRHKIGKPLRDRVFPVLQMTAASLDSAAPPEFLVVSIPIPDFAAADKSRLARSKDAQVARYVSVERIRKLPDGHIEWLMATASDAEGILPMWVQTMAMPGVVWKDVPLFLGWIGRERGKGHPVLAKVENPGGGNAPKAAPVDGPAVTTGATTEPVPAVTTAEADAVANGETKAVDSAVAAPAAAPAATTS